MRCKAHKLLKDEITLLKHFSFLIKSDVIEIFKSICRWLLLFNKLIGIHSKNGLRFSIIMNCNFYKSDKRQVKIWNKLIKLLEGFYYNVLNLNNLFCCSKLTDDFGLFMNFFLSYYYQYCIIFQYISLLLTTPIHFHIFKCSSTSKRIILYIYKHSFLLDWYWISQTSAHK